MTSLLFTEQFYYPEGWGGAQLPRDITIYLARCGIDVEVVCGSDQYSATADDPAVADPSRAGVRISRIPRLLGGKIHDRKVLKQLWFYLGCLPRLLLRRAPDVYVTQTNPPLIVPMVALVAWLRRRPHVIIAQDIYPEVMFAHGMASPRSLAGRLLAAVFRQAYGSARCVIALGPVMQQRLREKGVDAHRLVLISNWATGELGIVRGAQNTLLSEWGLEGKFVMLYSGNIGIAHDVETPIAALQRMLEQVPHARLVFIGTGSRLDEARREAARLGVEHAVVFKSFVPASVLPQTMGLADVALVTLREGFEGLVVPSKLLGYMARGVPTAYVGPYSDTESVLSESGGGVSFRNGDAERMAAVLTDLARAPDKLRRLGQAAADYYAAHLSSEHGLRRYREAIDAVVGATTRERR
jgi:colanic acid biosynthesis glycosyl transferase WcaI